MPAIYRSWSLAKTQVEAFSCKKYAGFEEWNEAINFMLVNGDHSEENITVYGQLGGH